MLKIHTSKSITCISKILYRGGSRGTANSSVGEQSSNYLLRKTKLKAIFALIRRCSPYLKSVIRCVRLNTGSKYYNSKIKFQKHRSGFSVNTDYVKVPIFLDFSPISLLYFPILCKLDNCEIIAFIWSVSTLDTDKVF